MNKTNNGLPSPNQTPIPALALARPLDGQAPSTKTLTKPSGS